MTGEFLVQRPASEFTPVQTGGLLCGVVPEANGKHLFPVCRAEVETVRGGLFAQLFLLKLHDLDYGLFHRTEHLRNGIRLLPSVFSASLGEIGDIKRGRVLGIGASENVAVCIVTEHVGHIASNVCEIRDGAVVHKDMAAKDEGVAVDLGDDAATSRPDVGKDTVGLRVAAETLEVEIVEGRGLRLVKSRPWTVHFLYVALRCGGIPGYPEAVHVEETIPHLEEFVR